MSITPKISIIVPVYNVEKYIHQCLDSILNQTLKDIEVICIDDGSTDNSFDILKIYGQKDQRIILKSRENKGVGYTRNEAMSMASGEFIAFMDPDDYYPDKNVLEKMYYGATNNNALICGGSLIVYNEHKNIEEKRTDFYNAFKKDKFIAFRDFQYDYGFQRYIYDRKLLVENGIVFPNYRRFQDPPFLIKAMACAEQFYAIHDYVYAYRWSPKKVNWTTEKVHDLLLGLRDDLQIASENSFDKLYTTTLNRIKKEYKEVILQYKNENIDYTMKEIMEICMNTAQKRLSNVEKPAKVSVVLPIYNASSYLRECLDSIINQTLQELEIICVNDGSTDDSLEIIKEYAAKDQRIIYIDKPNAGYGQTMNCGMALAKGEYIGIVEPDDFIKPNMYEVLYKKAKEMNLDYVKAGFFTFVKKNMEYQFEKRNIVYDNSLYDKVLDPSQNTKLLQLLTINPAGIFKRDFLCKYNIKHNETPGASYQDNGFWILTTYFAKRIAFIRDHFYCYRQDNPNQSIHKRNNIDDILREYELIDKRFEKDLQLKSKRSIYVSKKYITYMWHLKSRLDIVNWYSYLSKLSNEFSALNSMGVIEENFFDKRNFQQLMLIIKNPIESLVDLLVEYNKKLSVQEKEKNIIRTCMTLPENKKSEFYNKLKDRDSDLASSIKLSDFVHNSKNCTPIVMAANREYLHAVYVAIKSIATHATNQYIYIIYVYHTEFTADDIHMLESLISKNIYIQCIDVENKLNNEFNYTCAHFSREMYFRLLIPEMFAYFNKVLYLDCDIVCTKDIRILYDFEIGNNILGAAINPATTTKQYIEKELLLDYKKYFNSGVLLINCTEFNRCNIKEKCIEELSRRNFKFPDQDVLNIVCFGRVAFIDMKWNFLWHNKIYNASIPDYCSIEWKSASESPHIIHFCSDKKPWNFNDNNFAKKWLCYCDDKNLQKLLLERNINIEKIVDKHEVKNIEKKVCRKKWTSIVFHLYKTTQSSDTQRIFICGLEIYKKRIRHGKTRISILGMPLYSVKKEDYTTTRRILFFKYKKTNRIQLIQDKVWHNQQQIRKLVNELAESRKEIAALRNEVKAASSKPRRFILTEVDDK